MDNKICVYAIAKNEEQFVERWYNSMKEADLVVVLDTGSTDNTVDALEAIGVDIVETKIINPWRFDTARNESLKLVPDEYNILVCTDLDEVFEEGWADKLRLSWDSNIHERAEYKYIWKHDSLGNPVVQYHYNKIHNRDWIWRTPVHEYLTRKDDEVNFYYYRNNACDLYNDITLHHYPDNNKSRGSYLSLLEIRAEEYADTDPISLVYLAREYYFYNKFNDAIKVLNMITTERSSVFDPMSLGFSYKLMGLSYIGLISDKFDDAYYNAILAFNKGITANKSFLENYVCLAELYITYDEHELAKSYIEMGYKHANRRNNWMEDGDNWSYRPLEVLAIAYYCLGDKPKALSCAAKALTMKPNDESLSKNFNTILSNMSINDILKN